MEEPHPLLPAPEWPPAENAEDSRKLIIETADPRIRIVVVRAARQGALDAAYALHPERFPNGAPKAALPPAEVNINPLDSIIDMRRFLVLEESAAPQSLNVMFSNIENNGAPWAFSPSDRFNWADDLYVAEK